MSPVNHGQQTQTPERRGFTVVEMLVTIGILVVVAAGVATIFASVGDTVAKGRKLSELNQFAARLERVMRDDFEAMTRDGFLVIVNKNANYGRDVQLYRGEKSNIDENLFGSSSSGEGRIRRSDEIMFFTRGQYESARRAISPNMIATSSEAAIYYGHGQKRRPDLTSNFNGFNNLFFNPAPWDANFDFQNGINQAGVGVRADSGAPNPNEYARDWALIRQVTLLSTPLGESRAVPREVFGYSRDNAGQRERLIDSARQIALQPAARSIFNALNWSLEDRVSPTPQLPGDPEKIRWLGDEASNNLSLRRRPHYRASGVVDIVSEDLATIRSQLRALPAKVWPSDYSIFNPSGGNGANRGIDRAVRTRDQFEQDFWGTRLATDPTLPDPLDAQTINLNTVADHRNRMRAWMVDALPSRWDLSVTPPVQLSGVRYEDVPTRMIFDDDDFLGGDRGDLQRAYAEANQEMLASSVFVPRCTEFVVEWSYGFVDHSLDVGHPDYKQLIWYGLDRYIDSNNDGRLDNSDRRAALPYRQRSTQAADRGPDGQRRGQGPSSTLVVGGDNNRPQIFGGGAPSPFSPEAVEIATFGYMDPRGGGNLNDGEEWPWPKFIRITMSLGDPSDRDVEQTYQIVFEVPQAQR